MRKFFAGMLTMLLILCLGGSVLATTGKVQQEIEYRDIQESLNGKILDLKDAKGNTVEPFMFAGTNYIPARAGRGPGPQRLLGRQECHRGAGGAR